jgi:hypothetical protein
VPELPTLELAVRLPSTVGRATLHAPGRDPAPVDVLSADGRHALRLEGVPLYCIVHLRA